MRMRQSIAQFEREFRQTHSSAILYSRDRLHLRTAGARESVCDGPESAFRFRYEGLRLILRSGDHYFFLPDAWSPSNRVAIVIPEGDSVRLQFSTSRRATGDEPGTTAVGC